VNDAQRLHENSCLSLVRATGETLQLAAAYGAIANDGVLLQPTLIREIRDPSGAVLYRHRPEPVRRAVTPVVAARLRDLLRGVVEAGGTGERAALANFQLAAKTGTARRVVGGRYAPGQYTASFAAIFPADHPQLVVIVKIDNPRGNYYGGLTAAPVTRMMLQQALASRRVAIDRGRLAEQDSAAPGPRKALAAEPAAAPVVVTLPYRPPEQNTAARPVPDVAGRSIREAALALHRRGSGSISRGSGEC